LSLCPATEAVRRLHLTSPRPTRPWLLTRITASALCSAATSARDVEELNQESKQEDHRNRALG